MTAVIPREGILQRIEALRTKRAEIDAQIAENETWLRVLDDVEATSVVDSPPPPPGLDPERRRGVLTSNA